MKIRDALSDKIFSLKKRKLQTTTSESGQIERGSTLILPLGSGRSAIRSLHHTSSIDWTSWPSIPTTTSNISPWSSANAPLHFFPEQYEYVSTHGWRHSMHDWPSGRSRERPPGCCLQGWQRTEGCMTRRDSSRQRCNPKGEREKQRTG